MKSLWSLCVFEQNPLDMTTVILHIDNGVGKVYGPAGSAAVPACWSKACPASALCF